MRKIERVSLIGLGAMGVFFAPRLAETLGAGFKVIANGARRDRLMQKGITVNGTNYHFIIETSDVQSEPADLVIIAVKGYDLPQAIEDIRNQVGPDTIILSVLNGVESEKQVAAVYGEDHMLYSYMRASIAVKDGKADFNPDLGVVRFGEAKNDPENLSEKVLAVKELFDRCGIKNKVDEDMLKGIWFKFMSNVAENMTCATFGVPFGAFQKSDDANYFRNKAMWEVIAIANKLGVDIGQNEIDRQNHTLGRIPYENKPSTLQDIEAGKHTEVDMFAGTVVRLGKELGVETPICEMFYHGIRLIEARLFGEV